MKSPFPYFGGKSRVASLIWERFGNVPNYIEPFFGSGAVLLSRPFEAGTETVNDANGFLANFWRALQANPEEVATYADYPVSELDLHARHKWLMTEGQASIERLRDNPDFYDAKVAGWWVWGQCQWIGSGWCSGVSSWGGKPFADGEICDARMPYLKGAGQGIHRKRPNIGHDGYGVHRGNIGTADKEIAEVRQLSRQLHHLGDAGRGLHRRATALHDYLSELSERLRRVRICCGDWSRICGPTPTFKHGLTGVFLDPPYKLSERESVYSTETDCSADVRQWCIENGDNRLLRIALCGYEGEGHEILTTLGWDCVAWKAAGGYGNQGQSRGRDNRNRERIWFSPHCLSANLFTEDKP